MENDKLEVKHGYVLNVRNKCKRDGFYIKELDWNLEYIGNTKDACCKEFWKNYLISGILVEAFIFYKVEYVVYEKNNVTNSDFVILRKETDYNKEENFEIFWRYALDSILKKYNENTKGKEGRLFFESN